MRYITPARRAEVIALHQAGYSGRAIASMTGISRSHVWRICSPEGEERGRKLSRDQKRRTRESYYSKIDSIKSIAGYRCMDCEGVFPAFVLDFDHRPGEVKLFSITAGFKYTWDEVLTEIAKCDLVCANCHRMRTHARGWNRLPDDD